MSGCCDPRGCDQMFGDGFARHVARKFRRRGLDAVAGRMVDFLAADGVAGATVLDVGGGVGEIGIELLRRGAARATTLELSPAYDEEAWRLAREAGVADRVRRRQVDIAATPAAVEAADLVVLHRVVCCYPDHERLLRAVASRCRGRLAFSYPPPNAVFRGFSRLQNMAFGVLGREYRSFVHPPAAMIGTAAAMGMRQVMAHRGGVWHVAGLVPLVR